MSKEYPCIYFEEDGLCRKFTDGRGKVYCVMGPCPHQKESNADKIRAMSDEELAHLLTSWDFCSDVCSQQYTDSPFNDECPGTCKELALRWLQQPAEEET